MGWKNQDNEFMRWEKIYKDKITKILMNYKTPC